MKIFVAITLVLCVFGSNALADVESVANNTIVSPMTKNDSAAIEHKRRVVESLKQISNGNEQFSLEFLKRLSAAVSSVNYDFIGNFDLSCFLNWDLIKSSCNLFLRETFCYNRIQ